MEKEQEQMEENSYADIENEEMSAANSKGVTKCHNSIKKDTHYVSCDINRDKPDEERGRKTIQRTAMGESVAHSAKKSADALAVKYAKPDTYTGNRKLYDSESAKRRVKEEAFSKGVEVRDPYTGELLEHTRKGAKSKYGDEWQKHLAEGDHTVPIKDIYDKNRKSKWLNNDDIKEIANSDENLQAVSREFNNAKRSRTNKELVTDDSYMERTGLELSAEAKKKAIADGREAQKAINKQITKRKAQNVIKEGHQAGKDAAKAAGATTAIVSSVSNIVAVARGEKEAGEAVIDTATDTGKAVLAGYEAGAVEAVLLHTLKNSPSKFIKTLSNSTIIGNTVTIVMSTGNALKQYVNSEISIHELADAVAIEGVAMIGAAIGAPLGPIGSAVGAMVASTACNLLVSLKQKVQQSEKEYKNHFARMSKVESEALGEIQYQRKHLEEIINREFGGWDKSFESGFRMMLKSVGTNNFSGFADGLDKVMSIFQSEALFHNETEVEQFLFEDNTVFEF